MPSPWNIDYTFNTPGYSNYGSASRNFLGYVPGANVANPPVANTSGMSSIINQAVPGFSGLTKSASSIIGNLLGGLPSPDLARRENAYFGATSGLGSSNTDPTHDFLRNRGFDLYGEKAEQRQQTGLKDLLSLLAGYSGTVFPTTGQSIQSQQFSQEQGFERQAAIDNALKAEEMSQRRLATSSRYNPREYSFSSQKPGEQPVYSYRYFA